MKKILSAVLSLQFMLVGVAFAQTGDANMAGAVKAVPKQPKARIETVRPVLQVKAPVKEVPKSAKIQKKVTKQKVQKKK